MNARWRRAIFWSLIGLFAAVLLTHRDELSHTIETIKRGDAQWIIAAALLQALYYTFYVLHYQTAYRSVGIHTRFLELGSTLFAATFVNLVVPSGGTAGAALLVDDLSHRGSPPALTAIGTLLAGLVDYVAIFMLATIAVISLHWRNVLSVPVLIGYSVLCLFIAAMITSMSLVMYRKVWFVKLLSALARVINILFRRASHTLDEPQWPNKVVSQLSSATKVLVTHPIPVLQTQGIAIISYIVNIGSVFALFQAFRQSVSIPTVVVGFAIGMLFWIASITPQGIGTVEGAMILSYISLGIPIEVSAAVTVLFRGLTLWVPVSLGFFLLRKTKSFSSEPLSRWGPSSKA